MLMPHLNALLQEGFRMASGRRWCITENGYLGLIPRGSRIGDQVCLFYCGSIPFLVRPHAVAQDEGVQLVGHGYFHGLMHGEAFDLRSFKGQSIILK